MLLYWIGRFLCASACKIFGRWQVIGAENMPAEGGVLMCGLCLAFFAFILVLLTFEADTRSALIATPIWFAILGAAYAWLRGKRASQALMTPAEIEHVEQSQQA